MSAFKRKNHFSLSYNIFWKMFALEFPFTLPSFDSYIYKIYNSLMFSRDKLKVYIK